MHSYRPTPYFRQPWLKPAVIFFFSLIPLLIVLAIARVVTPIFAEFFAVWSVFLAAVFLGLAYKEGLKRDASMHKGKAFFEAEWRKVTSGIYIFSILSLVCFFFFFLMWVDRNEKLVAVGDFNDFAVEEAKWYVGGDYERHNISDSGNMQVLTVYSDSPLLGSNLSYALANGRIAFPSYFDSTQKYFVDYGVKPELLPRELKGKRICVYARKLEHSYIESLKKVNSSFDPGEEFNLWLSGGELWLDMSTIYQLRDGEDVCRQVSSGDQEMSFVERSRIMDIINANFVYPNLVYGASDIGTEKYLVLLGWSDLNSKFQNLVR